ncbi:hypothetical protein JRQ81_017830 [Phrynocephalus forsythii]|uniref:Phospholipid scramblase n=1 Tax=Phrynocephalus forsythii TaxID=171643 RepID=A0A9Q0XR43_9SAUR|nr:hypothetical protein JRQ81_017830 [Phrynocephalus forsythii]
MTSNKPAQVPPAPGYPGPGYPGPQAQYGYPQYAQGPGQYPPGPGFAAAPGQPPYTYQGYPGTYGAPPVQGQPNGVPGVIWMPPPPPPPNCPPGLEYLSQLEVHAPPGKPVGYIKQLWDPCLPKFTIQNEAREDILKIVGPCIVCSCCEDINFEIGSQCGNHKDVPAIGTVMQHTVKKQTIKGFLLSMAHGYFSHLQLAVSTYAIDDD